MGTKAVHGKRDTVSFLRVFDILVGSNSETRCSPRQAVQLDEAQIKTRCGVQLLSGKVH